MFEIIQGGLLQNRETSQEIYVFKWSRFDQYQRSSRPGTFFTGSRNAQNGIQDGIHPKLSVQSHHKIHFVYNIVSNGVGGVFP